MHARTYVCTYILHGMLGCIFVLPSSLILSSGTSCPVMKEKGTSPPTPHGSLMKVCVVHCLGEWEERVCSGPSGVCSVCLYVRAGISYRRVCVELLIDSLACSGVFTVMLQRWCVLTDV